MTDVSTIGRRCRCRHLDVFHNLNARSERTVCSWHVGRLCTPCGCRRFEAAS